MLINVFVFLFLLINIDIYSESLNNKNGIVGFGQSMIDYCVRLPENILNKNLKILNIKKKGDGCCINHQEKDNLLNNLSYNKKIKKVICSGGSTANTIAGISYLGEKATFVGSVGKDDFGDLFIDDLKKVGTTVFCDYKNSCEEGTGVVFSLISKIDGERSMAAYSGASLKNFQDNSFFKKSNLKKYDLIFSDGYMMLSNESRDFIMDLFKKTKENGGTTAFSLAALHVVNNFKKELLALLEHVDILFGNELEMKTLFGVKKTKKLFSIISKKVEIGLITMRENGAFIVNKGKAIIFAKTSKINNVVDSTGAGDMFAAGFLYGYYNNYSLKKAGQIGNKLAGEIIQKVGARP